MAPNHRKTIRGPNDDAPFEPPKRLVRTSFARLSSGFRVADPRDDRAVMELSDALQERLRSASERSAGERSPSEAGPSLVDAHAPPSMLGVLARMRTLAEGVEDGLPISSANADLGELVSQLRTSLEALELHSKEPSRGPSDVGPAGDATATVHMMQRLMSAIARARAIEGNVAGAKSAVSAVSEAEEQLLLARAQALLEEGVARFTRAPFRPRARQLLN
jgi:hypothetical protein